MGGLPRRATLVEKKRSESEPVFVVDAGNLYWRNIRLPENRREEIDLKAELIARSYAATGIDAMALAGGDLALGVERLSQLASEHSLPYLAANLTCGEKSPFPASRVVERGGVTIGFVGVYTGDAGSDCAAADPATAVSAAVKELESADVVVALGDFSANDSESLIQALPEVDFVISSSNLTLTAGKPITADNWLLASGSRGKRLGVLSATLVPGATGWQAESPGADLAKQIDSFNSRIAREKKRLESATSESARARSEKRIAFYEGKVEKLKADLAQATEPRQAPANTFAHELEALSRAVPDHEATVQLVAEYRPRLEELEPKHDAQRRPMVRGDMPGPRSLGALKQRVQGGGAKPEPAVAPPPQPAAPVGEAVQE